jgi:hypothetical protein
VLKQPYAFSNPRNALEDVLGLNIALVAAQISMTGGSGSWAVDNGTLLSITRASV